MTELKNDDGYRSDKRIRVGHSHQGEVHLFHIGPHLHIDWKAGENSKVTGNMVPPVARKELADELYRSLGLTPVNTETETKEETVSTTGLKEGDRIRLTTAGRSYIKSGSFKDKVNGEWEVSGVEPAGLPYPYRIRPVGETGSGRLVAAHEIESAPPAHTFKVGDRVRLVRNHTPGVYVPVGTEGTVNSTSVSFDGMYDLRVEFDEGASKVKQYVKADQIELVAAKAEPHKLVVGDRVKVVDDRSYHRREGQFGDIVPKPVDRAGIFSHYVKFEDGSIVGYDDRNVAWAGPRFKQVIQQVDVEIKVGDKVRLLETKVTEAKTGEIGTVKVVGKSLFVIDWETRQSQYMARDEFELVEDVQDETPKVYSGAEVVRDLPEGTIVQGTAFSRGDRGLKFVRRGKGVVSLRNGVEGTNVFPLISGNQFVVIAAAPEAPAEAPKAAADPQGLGQVLTTALARFKEAGELVGDDPAGKDVKTALPLLPLAILGTQNGESVLRKLIEG